MVRTASAGVQSAKIRGLLQNAATTAQTVAFRYDRLIDRNVLDMIRQMSQGGLLPDSRVRDVDVRSAANCAAAASSSDDVGLPAKVVVEIARADVEFVRDLVGPGPGLTVLIEQQQARNEDTLTRVSTHARTMGESARRFNGARGAPAIRTYPYVDSRSNVLRFAARSASYALGN